MKYGNVQKLSIVGKEVFVCVSLSDDLNKGPKNDGPCNLLGIDRKCYYSPIKDSFWNNSYWAISPEAIAICAYLSVDLSNIQNVQIAIQKKKELIEKWNEMNKICGGDWAIMLKYMSGEIVLDVEKESSGIEDSEEHQTEVSPEALSADDASGAMTNNAKSEQFEYKFLSVQTTTILGKNVSVCLNSYENLNEPPKKQLISRECSILGFEAKRYFELKKQDVSPKSLLVGEYVLSLEAITFCTYLGIDLSSLENVKNVVGRQSEIVGSTNGERMGWNDWNVLFEYVKQGWGVTKIDGEHYNEKWQRMCVLMQCEIDPEFAMKQQEIDQQDARIEAELNRIQFEEQQAVMLAKEQWYEQLNDGAIAFQGTSRLIRIYQDAISLNSIPPAPGLATMFDDITRIPDESIFIEDIRSVVVYEGKGASNVIVNQLFGGNTNQALVESISYIRFDLKGVNDINAATPSQHPYAVAISSEQLNEAFAFKKFIEKKMREIRSAAKSPIQVQNSSADDLIKYSTLLEKGLITNDEFNELKKKLLGL
jgi:hypothetical protein